MKHMREETRSTYSGTTTPYWVNGQMAEKSLLLRDDRRHGKLGMTLM